MVVVGLVVGSVVVVMGLVVVVGVVPRVLTDDDMDPTQERNRKPTMCPHLCSKVSVVIMQTVKQIVRGIQG